MRRLAPHSGIDLQAKKGATVLAAAGGEVVNVDYDPAGCGLGVLVRHGRFGRYTVYCHLARALVKVGQRVRRGQVLGHVGATGNAGDIPHLHWQLCFAACPFGNRDGLLEGTDDPKRYLTGCYRPRARHPDDRLALTYPLDCHR